MTKPRVRIAPSPTGFFHVGGARSALHNWVFARQHGGTFVLRIEDTDEARNRPEWTQGIIARWPGSGIDQDRRSRVRTSSAPTPRSTSPPPSGCSTPAAPTTATAPGRVIARTGARQAGYDGYCRDRGLEPGPGRALRFRTPDEGATVVHDLVRGEAAFANDTIEDFVMPRGNGSPMFMLANVVDDIDDAHHPRAARRGAPVQHAQAADAVGGARRAPPIWAHVPVVVNEKRKKLSKRRDKVALEGYRDEGYLAEAMRQLPDAARLGAGGDREIVPWSRDRGRLPARGRQPLARRSSTSRS